MHREAVHSSNIKSIGYDPATRKLHVEFHVEDGKPSKVVEYDDVGADRHAGLMAAESKGNYFTMHIRGSKRHAWRYL